MILKRSLLRKREFFYIKRLINDAIFYVYSENENFKTDVFFFKDYCS